MVCLGLKPGVAEWKAQKNPLCHGGTPSLTLYPIKRSVRDAHLPNVGNFYSRFLLPSSGMDLLAFS